MISHIPLPSLPGAAKTWKTGESYTIIHHTRAHTEAKKNKNIFYSFFYRTTDGAWATKEIAMLSFISFDTQAGGIIRIYFQNVPYSTPVWSNALIYGYGLVLVIYEASIWSLAEGAVQVCGWERMCVCIAHTSSPTQTHQTHTYTHIGHKYTYTGSKQHKIILLQPYFMCDDLVFSLSGFSRLPLSSPLFWSVYKFSVSMVCRLAPIKHPYTQSQSFFLRIWGAPRKWANGNVPQPRKTTHIVRHIQTHTERCYSALLSTCIFIIWLRMLIQWIHQTSIFLPVSVALLVSGKYKGRNRKQIGWCVLVKHIKLQNKITVREI